MSTPARRTRSKYISLREAGDLLGLSAKTIKRRIDSGQLTAKHTGTGRTVLRVAEDEVLALLRDVPTVKRQP